jgi:uncharacterized membrane protein
MRNFIKWFGDFCEELQGVGLGVSLFMFVVSLIRDWETHTQIYNEVGFLAYSVASLIVFVVYAVLLTAAFALIFTVLKFMHGVDDDETR